MNTQATLTRGVINFTVIIASLGYFVDFFDLLLFNITRVKSLTDLGLSGDALTQSGLFISNCQYGGILLGAYISGLMADKLGRKKALLFSIILYSLGSYACAFVNDVTTYGIARFITGVGIAGELGAGVTLILEKLRSESRGYGVMIFICMGLLGALSASLITEVVPWRHAYIIGGTMGLALLTLRGFLSEPEMFTRLDQELPRGGLSLIMKNASLRKRYICAILFVLPAVFLQQILNTLSPEIGKAIGIAEPIKANITFAVSLCFGFVADIAAIWLSERLKSKQKAAAVFIAIAALLFTKYVFWPPHDAFNFYIVAGMMGFTSGIWVLGASWAAEQFGVNIRATAATTIPNFARGFTIPMNIAYGHLKIHGPLNAVGIIGFVLFTLAFIGWRGLSETHGKNLDYYET